MRGAARRALVLRLLGDGVVDADALAEALGVSVSTVRRDLAVLAAEKRLLRTYGGAAVLEGGANQPERPLRDRQGERAADKARIAAAALAMVKSGDRVILDAGTSTGALARLLPGRAPLRVITNGLGVIAALDGAEGIALLALGGELRTISGSFIGPHAEATLRRETADVAFLGADGIVAGRGICEADNRQAALKELMAAQAARVVVLATADKLGRAASPCWCPLDRPWTLVTDASSPDASLAPFRARAEVTVIVAG